MSIKNKLIKWIEDKSLSGGRYEGDAEKASIDESDNEITISNDDIGLFGGAFKMDIDNMRSHLAEGPFTGVFEDFCDERNLTPDTMDIDDYTDYLSYATDNLECSPFGCGSDEQSDWTITYEKGIPYVMYYGRY